MDTPKYVLLVRSVSFEVLSVRILNINSVESSTETS